MRFARLLVPYDLTWVCRDVSGRELCTFFARRYQWILKVRITPGMGRES